MAKAKLAVTLDEATLSEVDRLVARHIYPNRSRIIEEAVKEKLARMNRSRLARECALLDPTAEQGIAEEGLTGDLEQWPEY